MSDGYWDRLYKSHTLVRRPPFVVAMMQDMESGHVDPPRLYNRDYHGRSTGVDPGQANVVHDSPLPIEPGDPQSITAASDSTVSPASGTETGPHGVVSAEQWADWDKKLRPAVLAWSKSSVGPTTNDVTTGIYGWMFRNCDQEQKDAFNAFRSQRGYTLGSKMYQELYDRYCWTTDEDALGQASEIHQDSNSQHNSVTGPGNINQESAPLAQSEYTTDSTDDGDNCDSDGLLHVNPVKDS